MVKKVSRKPGSDFKSKFRKTTKDMVESATKATNRKFDYPIKSGFELYKPTDGRNVIRFFPAMEDSTLQGTWFEGSIFLHYGIGPDESNYVCPKSTFGEPCPICEEEFANKATDKDYAYKLRAKKRCIVWVIDRNADDPTPSIWLMPITLFKEVSEQAVDENNAILDIVDLDEGFDISFVKEGKGRNTRYSGVKVARRSSPITDDEDQYEEWVQMLLDTPLEETLEVYDYEYLEKIFSGQPPAKPVEDDEDDEEEERPARKRKSSKKSRPVEEEDDEDEDDEDEDEDDDPPFDTDDDEDDEDEDEDEEEEEEEEEPAPRKKGSSRRKRLAALTKGK